MIPTGVEQLDRQIGGLPEGLIVLYEDSGAGGKEFALTVMMNNADKKLNYLAISKTKDEVERELKLLFPEAKKEIKAEIISLAEQYFRDSIIPLRWISEKISPEIFKERKNILTKLVDAYDDIDGIVLLDSITDVARVSKKIGWEAFIDLLKGIRSLCVKKNILTFGLLTAGVLERGKEEEIFELADGVLVFEWSIEKENITRWMFFKKMLGVMPLLEKERIVKYSIKIDAANGFMISRIMRVL